MPAVLLLDTGLGTRSTCAQVKLNEKSGQYATSTQLNPGATRIWETGINPRSVRAIASKRTLFVSAQTAWRRAAEHASSTSDRP